MALTMEQRLSICAAARRYIGVPCVPHGRSMTGLDCIGGMVMAYRDAGFPVDEGGRPTYRGIHSKRLMKLLPTHFDKIPFSQALPADVVVYMTYAEGHVGLLMDGQSGLNLFHVPAGRRAVEARFDPTRGVIRGVYTWRL